MFVTPASAATGQATSMSEVQDQFARCLHLPDGTAASRPTLYFSLTPAGGVVARPRIVLFGFQGTDDMRRRLVGDIGKAFAACLPLELDRRMAASLPGKVFLLQYVVSAKNQTTAVLFRPFGSHGGGGGNEPLPLEPLEKGFVPPNPTLALRPPPGRRQTFIPQPPAPYILLAPRGGRRMDR